MRKPLLFCLSLLLLLGIPLAGLKWSASYNGPIATQPALDSNAVYFAYNGDTPSVRAVNPSGRNIWSYEPGSEVTTNLAISSGFVIFGLAGGKVVALELATGKKAWESSASSSPSAIATNSQLVFALSPGKLYALSPQTGKEVWSVPAGTYTSTIGTSPTAVFASIDDGISTFSAAGGAQKWASPRAIGQVWNSVPQISQRTVYVGSTDGKLYALDEDTGFERWSAQTNGWVSTTPEIGPSMVYFGSNDGKIYAVDSATGKQNWQFATGEAVWSAPRLARVGSGTQTILLAGSNDGKVYALDPQDGSLLWSYIASGWVQATLPTLNNAIIFTRDGKVSSLILSPTCSIDSPSPGAVIGDAELVISGTAYSAESSGLTTRIRVNGGSWISAGPGRNWSVTYDPSALAFGPVRIECSASDSVNSDQSDKFNSVTISKSQSAPLLKMSLSAPASPQPGSQFQLVAKDQQGKPLTSLSVLLAGKSYSGNSPLSLTAPASGGSYDLTVSKKGYEKATIKVNVQGDSTLLYALGAVLVLGAFAYVKFGSKLLKKK